MIENNISQDQVYERFCVLHRILHIVVIVTFTLLTITGFALRFSTHGWAQVFVSFIGGADSAGWLHRASAAIFYVLVMLHLIWLAYYKLILKGSLTGPQSVFPQLKDFQDLCQNFRYIFGKGEPPLFNRFSYLEKVDYWAVLLGMQSMGITGLLMCYPEFFSTIVPGYFINVANDLHFHEAVLAVGYIAIVHMSSTHLVPEVFPMEKSIFNGKMTKQRVMKEHPGEWKSICAPGESAADPSTEK